MTTTIAPTRTDWTKDEAAEYMERCHPDVRYELIDGEIVLDMPSPQHNAAARRVKNRLEDLFGRDFVRKEENIHLPESETKYDLVPDCVVTRQDETAYYRRHPAPEDILLAVEVSATSLADDNNKKRRLYARCGIKEYWVLDLANRRLLVYRVPRGGDYPDPAIYGEEDEVDIIIRPETKVRVGELLPPVEETL